MTLLQALSVGRRVQRLGSLPVLPLGVPDFNRYGENHLVLTIGVALALMEEDVDDNIAGSEPASGDEGQLNSRHCTPQ